MRAEAAADAIAQELVRADGGEEHADGSLISGAAGIALFLFYAERALGGRGYRAAAGRALGRALDWVAEAPLGPSLYTGYLGVAWVVAHLGREAEEFVDDGSLDAIDDAVVRHLTALGAAPGTCDFDLLKGVAGIGLYALERPPSARRLLILRLVLQSLHSCSVACEQGRAWATAPTALSDELRSQYPGGVFNVGVAHGTPGVIALLAQLTQISELRRQAEPILAAALQWLLSQERRSGFASLYPAVCGRVRQDAPCTVAAEPYDGPAWCYGDPGIAGVLALVSELTEDATLPGRVQRLADAVANVRYPRPNGPTLCHGTGGLAQIYARLGQLPGCVRYLEWAARCTSQLIERWEPSNVRRQGTGLLYGASGAGLALLAACDQRQPAWDVVLGLSSCSLRE